MTLPDDMKNMQSKMQAQMAAAVKGNWKMFLIEGIVLVVLGLAAVAIPSVASVTFTIMLGWLFLIGGVLGLYVSFMMRNAPGFGWSLLSAALALGAGLLLLVKPLQGVVTLTILLGAYFIAEGITTIMYALRHRGSGRWAWLLFSGLMDLLIAALIVTSLPESSTWAIGLLVGINLVFGGTSLIAMALAARNA